MKNKLDEKSFNDIIREELDNLQESRPKSSRTKDGRKVPGKYLTKDKAAMKGEIERVSKLKSDDPDAYGKWVADYKARNTATGKPHKTKKSAATIAYEKRFGKKNENMNHNDKSEEIESEIEMMMRPTDDKLSHDELQDIADAYGADFEDVLQIMNSYLEKREKRRQEDFSEAVHELFIDTDRTDFTDNEKWDFWVKNGYGEEMPWLSKKDFIKGIKKLTTDPNQLSLFTEDVDVALSNKAKSSGISKSILRAVYSKGAAAWKSGHRPGVSQQQWAMGRVNSFITGKGGSRKVDAKLWARAKKSKKRKNESLEESELRRVVRSIITEMFDEKGIGSDADLSGPDVTKVLPYSDLLTAIAEKWGWDHDLTQQVSYALEIKNPDERERRIIALLNDYDVYDEFFPYLRMNEGGGIDELYPLMVGEDNMEEGIGKYLAGAALAASLAGAPMKSSAQTPVKDFAKEKIAMVQDKASDIKSNVKDFAKDQFAGAKEKIGSILKKKDASQPVQLSQNKASASVDSLNSQVGKVVKVGEGRYMTVEREDFPSMGEYDFAEKIAIQRAQSNIASSVKGKEVSPGRVVTSARLTDTNTENRLFPNPDGGYTLFVTVSSSVN